MSEETKHTPWAFAWQTSYTGDEWHFARQASFSPSDLDRGIVKNVTHLSVEGSQMLIALRKASQLASVASDWNLYEVEINGEMVSIYDLKAEFDREIANSEGGSE